MEKMPLITIITVCYNSEKTIEKTIKSVLNQTYQQYEYILVDGQSVDNTILIINKYKVYNDKINVISEKDHGIYNAMNKGIKLAKGELIGIINSDDWYEQDALETVVMQYKKYGSGIYYGIERKIKNDIEFSLERTNIKFLNEKMIQHSTCFVSKEIYDQYGVFNEKYKFSADYDLMIRMREKRVSFFAIDRILSNFTIGGASSTPKAALETLKIKFQNNFISRKEYMLKFIKNIIKKCCLRFN